MKISIDIKKSCVEKSQQGQSNRDIYTNYFRPLHPSMSYETFRHKILHWKNKQFADADTLKAGTYPEFYPHDATVQIDKNGDVVQAWVKQKHDADDQINALIQAIRENTTKIDIPQAKLSAVAPPKMLEIPLFDLHIGLNNDYTNILGEIISVVEGSQYEEINITVGQDLLHNDDLRGRTAKGTPIEKIDMVKAWAYAKEFYNRIITASLKHASRVNVIYSKGNHDESISWAFMQMLKATFDGVFFDDRLKPRKCISWRGCFVGLCHGDATKSNIHDLRGQFTIEYPVEFATAHVREIHAGHLHHEREADIYGVMVRRLSTANKTDEWHEQSGFIGANKRFMLFEWTPYRLSKIHYIGGELKR